MIRWIARILLSVALVAMAAMLFYPPLHSWRIEQAFDDRLIKIGQSAAIQAGYVSTMHEQRWGSHAFVNILGLSLPRGKTEVRIRAPIRVYYGVTPANLHLMRVKDGILHIAVDKVTVLNVATSVARLEMETEVGWARLDAISGEEARKAAKRAFERTKYHAADKLLSSRMVTEHVRIALKKIAKHILGVRDVRITRRDIPAVSP